MTRVLVTHPSDKLDSYFGANALAALRELASEVRLNPQAKDLDQAELIAAAQGCDAVIAYRQTPAPAALFDALPDLVALLRCAVDIRTIDVAAASEHGVLVTHASPGYVPAVAEWVIGVMISLARGIGRYGEAFHSAQPVQPTMGRELRGATLGIIGLGQIGRYLADLALALRMQVLVHTPGPVEEGARLKAVSLPALLAGADFVVCLAPANADTENMLDARAFATMQRGSYFINAARGELVDENALWQALESGHLAGCALDVGRAPDQMPTPVLARHSRVIATPHIGGLTLPAVEHQAMETVEQLTQLLAGRLPAGAVNAVRATRLRRWGHVVS